MKKKVKVLRTISDVLTAISVAMYAGILCLGGELTPLNKILLGVIFVMYLIRFVGWIRVVVFQKFIYKSFIKNVNRLEILHRIRYKLYFSKGQQATAELSEDLENLITISLSCEPELYECKYLTKKQKQKVKDAAEKLKFMKSNFQPQGGTL